MKRFFSTLALFALTAGQIAPLAVISQTAPADGSLIKGDQSSAVYFLSGTKRHAFPNERTYFTWYSDFSTVVTVSTEQLASFPLGENVTSKPGSRLIKIATDPRVYAVEKGGVLRWVQTEAMAKSLYGDNWAKSVDDVPDAFFTNYVLGNPISDAAQHDPATVRATTSRISENFRQSQSMSNETGSSSSGGGGSSGSGSSSSTGSSSGSSSDSSGSGSESSTSGTGSSSGSSSSGSSSGSSSTGSGSDTSSGTGSGSSSGSSDADAEDDFSDTSETFSLLSAAAAAAASPTPSTTHPRLLFRPADVTMFRSWISGGNPLYENGLRQVAEEAKADMDAGDVVDEGGNTWTEYPSESYAELFAFMSMVAPTQAERDNYGSRARTMLMHAMNQAVKGAADGQPFRDPAFAIDDRSRWNGEGWALAVDWAYPYFSAADKVTIRKVFLRWADENMRAETTSYNHPEPIGVINSPSLVADKSKARWAGNNYFAAHTRNLGLMAMALDSADDPGNTLRNYLSPATGAWLYMVDHLASYDSAGGLFPEGPEYSPQSTAYVMQLLVALKTAGQDDAAKWGKQVVLTNNLFWRRTLPAFLHLQAPKPVINEEWLGPVYQPAWYGAGQNFWSADPIPLFGPLGLYSRMTGDTTLLNAVRWTQKHIPPGGPSDLASRAEDDNSFLNTILYFATFDPKIAEPTDPRPKYAKAWYAQGTGKILARTDWTPNATMFDFTIGWNTVDHQSADGNSFDFYRNGEWLTKRRVGYDLDYAGSHNMNTMLIENDKPDRDDHRKYLADKGSQMLYSGGDGKMRRRTMADSYVFALGDATALYNSDHEDTHDVTMADRSILWVKPDFIVTYDRTETTKSNRFKRYNLMLPATATVSGNRATMVTPKGQSLFVTSLLPAGARITSGAAGNEPSGTPANGEPMKSRLQIEALNGPAKARFLTLLQGANSGTSATAALLVKSTGGTAFDGVAFGTTVAMFPTDLVTVQQTTYVVPASVTTHYVTGLTPNAGYTISKTVTGSTVKVTITSGGSSMATSGGVLKF